MNKQALRGAIWIASDIHLGEAVPETARAFYAFLDRARRHADALVLCGDLFDAWIGDDHALRTPPAWLAATLDELRATADAIPLWLARGNRDFLIAFSDRDPQHMAAITSQVRRDARRREHALTPELLVWQAGRIRALDPHH